MTQLRLVKGSYYTHTGIPLEMGVRCPHSVVDGNKPLTNEGPRCLACRETWYPVLQKSDLGHGIQDYAHCPTCGDILHETYSSAHEDVLGADGKFVERKHVYKPGCWSHASPRGCSMTDFPIRGYEQNYHGYGWGRWEEYTEQLIREFHDHYSRAVKFRELYGV